MISSKVFLIAASLAVATGPTGDLPKAYLTGERVTNGTKQCYYDYLGDTYIRTIKSHQLCPLSIEVSIGVR